MADLEKIRIERQALRNKLISIEEQEKYIRQQRSKMLMEYYAFGLEQKAHGIPVLEMSKDELIGLIGMLASVFKGITMTELEQLKAMLHRIKCDYNLTPMNNGTKEEPVPVTEVQVENSNSRSGYPGFSFSVGV